MSLAELQAITSFAPSIHVHKMSECTRHIEALNYPVTFLSKYAARASGEKIRVIFGLVPLLRSSYGCKGTSLSAADCLQR